MASHYKKPILLIFIADVSATVTGFLIKQLHTSVPLQKHRMLLSSYSVIQLFQIAKCPNSNVWAKLLWCTNCRSLLVGSYGTFKLAKVWKSEHFTKHNIKENNHKRRKKIKMLSYFMARFGYSVTFFIFTPCVRVCATF